MKKLVAALFAASLLAACGGETTENNTPAKTNCTALKTTCEKCTDTYNKDMCLVLVNETCPGLPNSDDCCKAGNESWAPQCP